MPLNNVNSKSLIVNRLKKPIHHLPFSIHFKVKRGFTLIELLIVITILGILAGLTLASYSGTQERSRDSRRKTDLDAIKKALELARQDTPGAYYYADCNGSANCGVSIASVPLSTRVTLAPNYIKSIPKDPKTNSDYTYIPNPVAVGTTTSYSLIACLENTRDTQRDEVQNGGSNNTSVCGTTGLKSLTITPN